MPLRQVYTPAEQLQPFARCRIVGLLDGLLQMLGTMYWWCVAAFSSGLGNIPTPIDRF